MANPSFVKFRCGACNARLRAPVKLVGQARPCPACGESLVLQPVAPEPAGPILILDDSPGAGSGRERAGYLY